MPAFWVASRRQRRRLRAGAGATSSTAPARFRCPPSTVVVASRQRSTRARSRRRPAGAGAPRPRGPGRRRQRVGAGARHGADAAHLDAHVARGAGRRGARLEQLARGARRALPAPRLARRAVAAPAPEPVAERDGRLLLPADDFGFRHGSRPAAAPAAPLPAAAGRLTALDAALDAPRRLSDGLAGARRGRRGRRRRSAWWRPPPPARARARAARVAPASPVAALPSCTRCRRPPVACGSRC